MQLLIRIMDPVALQVLSDALRQAGIDFRIDGTGMSSLMPLTGIFESRVMVEPADMAVAERILADLGMNDD